MAAGSIILLSIAGVAGAYQLFAIAACLAFLRRRPEPEGPNVPVSILKPVRGLDPRFREAIESHLKLEGEFELLAGVRDKDDPAVPVLREFAQVRVVEVRTQTPNGKVGALADLASAARHDTLIASDADIRNPLRGSRAGFFTSGFASGFNSDFNSVFAAAFTSNLLRLVERCGSRARASALPGAAHRARHAT